jgi:hypothetical protein
MNSVAVEFDKDLVTVPNSASQTHLIVLRIRLTSNNLSLNYFLDGSRPPPHVRRHLRLLASSQTLVTDLIDPPHPLRQPVDIKLY